MVFGQSSLGGLFRTTGLKSPIDRMTRCRLGADLLGGKVGWATIGIAHGTSVATMGIEATIGIAHGTSVATMGIEATIGIAHGTSVATMGIEATVASRDAVAPRNAVRQGATRVHHKGGFVGADFTPLARRAILKESRGGYSRRHKDQDAKN